MSSFADIYQSAKHWFKIHCNPHSSSKLCKKEGDLKKSPEELKALEQNKRKISFAHEISELLIELKTPKTINDLKKRENSIEEKHALGTVIKLIHKCLEGIQWTYYHSQDYKVHTSFEFYLQNLITQILSSEDLNESQKARVNQEISQHLENELSKAQTSSEKSSLAGEISQIREKVWPVLQKIALYQTPRAIIA